MIDSALRYRVQAPLIDSILSEIGMEGGSLSKLPGLIREARDLQGIKESTARAAKTEGGEGSGDKPAGRPGRGKSGGGSGGTGGSAGSGGSAASGGEKA